jgi:hypothetical protein
VARGTELAVLAGRGALAQQNRVGVLSNGSFTINDTPVASQTFTQQLAQMFIGRASRIIYLKGDPRTRFRDVAGAIDMSRAAGVDVVLVSMPSQRRDLRVDLHPAGDGDGAGKVPVHGNIPARAEFSSVPSVSPVH